MSAKRRCPTSSVVFAAVHWRYFAVWPVGALPMWCRLRVLGYQRRSVVRRLSVGGPPASRAFLTRRDRRRAVLVLHSLRGFMFRLPARSCPSMTRTRATTNTPPKRRATADGPVDRLFHPTGLSLCRHHIGACSSTHAPRSRLCRAVQILLLPIFMANVSITDCLVLRLRNFVYI